MDTFLANYFGTNQSAPEPTTQEDDLEKMAQLVMLDKIASAKNIDLSGLSDDEYVQLAGQVFSGQPVEKTAAAAQPEANIEMTGLTELEKQAKARFEEAKFLGQVVAHSMWNELDSIQKVAMAKGEDEEEGEKKAPPFPPKKEEKKDDEEEDEKSKEGSALDTLADARAYEILQGYGLADDQGNVVSPDELNKHAQAVYAQQQGQAAPAQPEKTAADRLSEAVESSAWEKLASAGYDPQVINYLLQVQQAQTQGQ